ncbi:hypothetical protein ACH5RR_040117 [Cinchona calisaya]|uniref:Gag1-like clamp domain-containing protein n=1 Tax=Cinchona calisaya TaxID=153742 RepID=A0ABD2XU31_9GENT
MGCCLLIQPEDACLQRKPLCSFLLYIGGNFRALVGFMMEKLKEKGRILFSSRGCLGCCTRPPLVISVNEPSKGHKIQAQRVKKRSITEDFWSSSTHEMDNSAFPSQRSISSISTSNQTIGPHGTSGSSSNPTEFVNHGLLLWTQTRQQWVGDEESKRPTQAQDPKLDWNATYDSLLGTNKPFPQPIPVPEMVNFLVDVWEQEGLYD